MNSTPQTPFQVEAPRANPMAIGIWMLVTFVASRALGLGRGMPIFHSPLSGEPLDFNGEWIQAIVAMIAGVIPVIWNKLRVDPTIGPIVNFINHVNQSLRRIETKLGTDDSSKSSETPS